MKTRQELILEFMLELSSNSAMVENRKDDRACARDIFLLACEMTDKYLGVC